MSKRSRERQLAKLAARRQAERDAERRNRMRLLGVAGIVIALLLVTAGAAFLFQDDKTQAAPSPTSSATPSASNSPSVACDATVPKTADEAKPTFDAPPPMTIDESKIYTATMRTSCGDIVIELDPEHAPIGVNSFVFLANEGFFDGLTFHRIVKGFVIQGGDPTGDGTGDPGYEFETETSPEVTFDSAGILAYANGGPDTNGSQFFITLAPTPQLDPSPQASYTIFGKVVEGLDVVKRIGDTPVTQNPATGENSVPTQRVYIERVTVSAGS